jgi:hypothetical protein
MPIAVMEPVVAEALWKKGIGTASKAVSLCGQQERGETYRLKFGGRGVGGTSFC